MTEEEFLHLVLGGSKNNEELENKVQKQGYVYIKKGSRTIKVELISIQVFPYGEFDVGNWNGKEFKNRATLRWEGYNKNWALTKGELE